MDATSGARAQTPPRGQTAHLDPSRVYALSELMYIAEASNPKTSPASYARVRDGVLALLE